MFILHSLDSKMELKKLKLISLKSISKEYLSGANPVKAVKNVSLDFCEGEFSAIIGPSGSGKSTLLNIIGCIDRPSSGEVFIQETMINNLNENELADLRATTLGFIFQSFNLLSVLTVEENVAYPLSNNSQIDDNEKKKRVDYYIERVGLSRFKTHRPNQLSGGQRQRVAIARALAPRPKVVLADEPTANLDAKTGQDVLNLMAKLNEEDKITFIFSTHDQRVVNLARRKILIEDGVIKK